MALTLDTSASDALRHLATGSNCNDPIAVFSKRSRGFKASEALRDALASNEAHRLRDVAERELGQASGRVEFFLDVFMYERAEVRADDIVSIDGVDFELPSFMRTFLQEARLFYEDGFFVIRNRDGAIVDLPFGPADAKS